MSRTPSDCTHFAYKTTLVGAAALMGLLLVSRPAAAQFGTPPPPGCGTASGFGCEGTQIAFPKNAPTPVGGRTYEGQSGWRGMPPGPGMPEQIVRVQSALTGEGSNVQPQGTTSCTGSYVDNLRWNYVHTSIDYAVERDRTKGTACPANCGATMTDRVGELPHLKLIRIHRPRHSAAQSAFGPTVFTQYDSHLFLFPASGANDAVVQLYDAETDAGYVTLHDVNDPTVSPAPPSDPANNGVFLDFASRTYKSLDLFDATNTHTGNLTTAVKAVLTGQTGQKWTFEIIRTGSATDPNRQGRLIRKEDPFGNAEAVITYSMPANTTATTGRDQLWNMHSITDQFNVTAQTFYDQLNTGRWVITEIDFPTTDSTLPYTLFYSYDTAKPGAQLSPTDNGLFLNRITNNIDGTFAQFPTSFDNTYQEVVISFTDPWAGPNHIVKSILVTEATVLPRGGNLVPQIPNVVRHVFNGQHESVYRNWENPSDSSLIYIFEAPSKLFRIKRNAAGYPIEYAEATAAFFDGEDPTTKPMQVVETYQANTTSMMTQRARSDGATRNFTRDAVTRAITGVTLPNGTSITATYNSFLRPLTLKNERGTNNTFTYDTSGRLTNMTVASGSATPSSWSMAYNSLGQPIQMTDPKGNVTDYGYNSRNLLATITFPPDVAGGARGHSTTFYETNLGQTATEVDADGRTYTYTYDLLNRLTVKSYSDGTFESFTYGSTPAPFTFGLLTARADRNAVQTSFSYDGALRLRQVVRGVGKPEAQTTTYTYLAGTNMIGTEMNAGDATDHAYDFMKRETRIRTWLPSGSTPDASVSQFFAYDAFNRKVTDTDIWGRITYTVYDSMNRVTRTVRELTVGGVPAGTNLATLARVASNPAYAIDDYTYENGGRVATHTDARGFVEANTYDVQGNKTQVVLANGTPSAATTKYQYDANGNVVRTVRPRTFTAEGNSVDTFRDEVAFTGRDLILSETIAAGRPEAITRRYTYTLAGLKATMVDGNGKTTSYKYDTCCGRLTEVDDPSGFSTKYAYDGNGNKISETDGNNNTTSFAYDAIDRIVRQTNPANEASTFEYDDNLTDGVGIDPTGVASGLNFSSGVTDGAAVRTTNPLGQTFITVFDALGRGVRDRDGRGNQTTLVFSVVNNLAETARNDPMFTTKSRRDGNGVIREYVAADASLTTQTADAKGNILTDRDPGSVGYNYVYDEINRRTSETDTQGTVIKHSYDVEGNEITRTNGLNKIFQFAYNGRNVATTETDELSQVTTFAYDGEGHKTSMTDPEGKITRYAYDPRGLLTGQTFSDGRSVSMAFDGARRLTSTTDQAGRLVTYSYDVADRMLTRAYPNGLNDTFAYDHASNLTRAQSARYNNVVQRAYDANGNITQETNTIGGTNYVVSYGYDQINRPTGLTYPNGLVVQQAFNPRSQLASIFANGINLAVFTRNASGLPTQVVYGNGVKDTRTYRLDNRLATEALAQANGTSLYSLSYTYDADKRKTQETNGITAETQTLTYDDVARIKTWAQGTTTNSWVLSADSNWTSITRNGVTETRTHGTANELTTLTPSGGSAITLTHDVMGNMTLDASARTNVWDFDNQLQSTTASGATITYAYDALHRRVSKTVGGVTTVFVNSGDKHRERVLSEYDNGVFARSYFYGDYVDELLAMFTPSTQFYFTSGESYSVQVATNSAGAIAERYKYNSYGSRTIMNASGGTISNSAIGNRIGYTGRYHDETSYTYFRSRMYASGLGRFISRDVDFFDGPNLYGAYFLPNGMDPTGARWGFKSLGSALKSAAKATGSYLKKGAKYTIKTTVKYTNELKDEFGFDAEAMIEGEGKVFYNFCEGDFGVEGSAKLKAGAGVEIGGMMNLGAHYEKTIWSGKAVTHVAHFSCSECSKNCCDSAAFDVGAKFDVAKYLGPLNKLGVTCRPAMAISACKMKVGGSCTGDLLNLFPPIEAIKKVAETIKIGKVQADLTAELNVSTCLARGSSGGLTDGELAGKLAIGAGLAVKKEFGKDGKKASEAD